MAVSEHTQTDPDMASMFCLGFSAFMIARSAVVVDDGGRRDPPALWVIVIAESRAGKSASFRPLVAPIRQLAQVASGGLQPPDDDVLPPGPPGRPWYERLLAEDEPQAEAVGAPWASAREVGNRLRLAQEAEFPGVPVRFMAADVTPEALVQQVAGQILGVLQASPEAELLTRVSAGGPSAVATLSQLNQMWVGETIEVNRVGRGWLTATWPILSIVVSPQPVAFREMRSGRLGNLIAENGFLARCMVAVPRSTVGTRRPGAVPMPPAVEIRYAQNLRAMLAATLPRDNERTVLRLSTEAVAVSNEHYARIEPELALGGALHDVRFWADGVRQSTARIAAVLHVADLAHQRPDGMHDPISGSAMERAVEIARWQLECGQQVWTDGPAQGPGEAEVVARVRRMGQPTVRDLYRALGLSGPGPLTPILDRLLARGVLVRVPGGRTARYRLVDG